MGHYIKGRSCTGGCGRAISWRTPEGKFEVADASTQYRCPKCVSLGREVEDQRHYEMYKAQDEWRAAHS